MSASSELSFFTEKTEVEGIIGKVCGAVWKSSFENDLCAL